MPSGGKGTEYDKEACCTMFSNQSDLYRQRLRPIVSELELPSSRKRQIDRNLLFAAGQSQANAAWSQAWSMRLNLIMLVFGIIVSALIVVQHSQQVSDLKLETPIFWVLIIFSLLNNIATGTQQLFNFSDIAKTHDEAFAKMDHIAWSYFMNTGEFEGLTHEEGFPLFAKRINDAKQEESQNLRNAKSKGEEATKEARDKNEATANKKLATYQKKGEDEGEDEDKPPKRRTKRRRRRSAPQLSSPDAETDSSAAPVHSPNAMMMALQQFNSRGNKRKRQKSKSSSGFGIPIDASALGSLGALAGMMGGGNANAEKEKDDGKPSIMESLGAAATLAKATGILPSNGDDKADDDEPSVVEKAKTGLAGMLSGAAEALTGPQEEADKKEEEEGDENNE